MIPVLEEVICCFLNLRRAKLPIALALSKLDPISNSAIGANVYPSLLISSSSIHIAGGNAGLLLEKIPAKILECILVEVIEWWQHPRPNSRLQFGLHLSSWHYHDPKMVFKEIISHAAITQCDLILRKILCAQRQYYGTR